MLKFKTTIAITVLALALGGCVSKKKFGQMEALKTRAQSMLDKKKGELKDARNDLRDVQSQLRDCEEARKGLEQDTARMARINKSLKEHSSEMKLTCDQLNQNYQKLKARSTKKLRELVEQLEELQFDLNERETRLAEVERMLHQRDSVMTALRERVSEALLGFTKDGLTVEIKNGKVYVSLSNKLLFASGSTKIDATGQQALGDLALVLRDQEDLNIMVEGHTDDVPVSNLGQIKDNWDLSVMRSTEVVRALVEGGVAPARIIPAGRGEFIPKVGEQTDEARAANRRTEIIISPKLDELYELINQQR